MATLGATGVKKAKGGKKNRKIGRNKKWCEAYRNRGQREKNKCIRIRKHLARFPNDPTARHLLANGGWRQRDIDVRRGAA